jgi:hypothetical protein
LGFVGLVMVLIGFGRLFSKPVSAVGGVLSGGFVMALGAAIGLAGLNVLTYQRLSYEQPVAVVTLRQTAPQAFIASVRKADGEGAEYDLLGDEWQMDARVLKWRPWANVIGLDAVYRLERLSGRYSSVEAEKTAPRSVHALATTSPGLDIWAIAQKYGKYAPVVDATYGSGTYVPMADGATYEVTMSQTGLLARPTNDAARAAVQNWK